MLDLPEFGVPPCDILIAAANALWVREPMQKVVAEFVAEGEVDPAFAGAAGGTPFTGESAKMAGRIWSRPILA